MKLSDKTISLLRNFVDVNQSLMFRSGNKIKTMSLMKNLFAEASITETIPRDFAIYDLGQFLNGVSLHQNPEITFDNDSYLTIHGGGHKTKYYFADPSLIISPSLDKEIKLPSEDVCFELSSDQLKSLLKASAVYQIFDLTVIGDGKSIKLLVRDKENSTSNEFSINVGQTDSIFTFNFRVENLKILPGKYEVVISQQNFSRFRHTTIDLVYYIALEPDSTFGE
jgi:hypothetical protein